MQDNIPHNALAAPPQRAVRRDLLRATLAGAAGAGLQAVSATKATAAEHGSAMPSHGEMGQMKTSMQEAIKNCLDCHGMCVQMATNFCPDRGGRHVEREHLKLMVNCADICQTSANFMLSDSPLAGRICAACAEVCEACARSCEQVGDMRDCVDQCRRTARSCKAMS